LEKNAIKLDLQGLEPRQAKLVELLLDNAKSHRFKSKKAILLEAGYSKSQSCKPFEIIRGEGVQRVLAQLSQKMDNVANTTLTALEKADYEKVSPEKTAIVFDKIMRNKALINGQSTDNVAMNVSWS
tara:strand:- start:114 stop:494 length:381 start_codon:yes stop_codon:yes gene_type:complete